MTRAVAAALLVVAAGAATARAAQSRVARIHGKVVAIDRKRGVFQIHHDPFPQMPMAMTMEVKPRDRADLAKLHVGEIVTCTADMSTDPWLVTGIRPAH